MQIKPKDTFFFAYKIGKAWPKIIVLSVVASKHIFLIIVDGTE